MLDRRCNKLRPILAAVANSDFEMNRFELMHPTGQLLFTAHAFSNTFLQEGIFRDGEWAY